MLQRVDVGRRSLAAYRGMASDTLVDEVLQAAEPLAGARVLHLSATPYGGGVSELLRSMVPLLNDLGLVADWQVISGDDAFFKVTKAMHNALQGADLELSAGDRATYEATAERNARLLGDQSYDLVFVHDPQPAALHSFHNMVGARWVWRCHIDTSQPDPAAWQFLRGFLTEYDAAIFTMAEFLPPDIPIERLEIIPPAIDPQSPKNLPLPDGLARQVLAWIGIELERPMLTQVSRFDPWKDPLGVIAAYRLVREEVPNLQLALAGSMALDDPEGWAVYRQISDESEADPLIHVFTNLTGVGNLEVNAFQRLSDVVVQKSIREGFGLVVSEAMWKGTPVVAGRTGGIPLQMADGAGGMLVDGVEDCADSILKLLEDQELASELGTSGRERVREHFLLPRLLLNELALMGELVSARPVTERATCPGTTRDPVCGMAIEAGAETDRATYDGRDYVFCSESCRTRFLDNPEHYLLGGQPNLGAHL